MTTSASNPTELANAVRQFCDLIDPDAIGARQTMGPATVYYPCVVMWMLVYQRLHANSTPAEAVAELLRSAQVLPPNRRIATRTLSASTGANSRARTRLRPDVPDTVADRVFDNLVAVTRPRSGAPGDAPGWDYDFAASHRQTPRGVLVGHQRVGHLCVAGVALGGRPRTRQRLRPASGNGQFGRLFSPYEESTAG